MRFMGLGWIVCGFIFQYLYYGEASLTQISTWVVVVLWPFILMWVIFTWVLWAIFIGCVVYLLLAFVANFLPGIGLSKTFFQVPWIR